MPIQVGAKIPSVLVKRLTPSGVQDMNTDLIFKGKKVVMFGIPGAFTPTCSTKHLPGFIEHFQAFKDRGIDVVCMSVNDPFVMNAWFSVCNTPEGIQSLCDGSAIFTKALGVEMNGNAYGLGTRSQRFGLYAEDGIVRLWALEKPGAFEVSDAASMLAAIDKLSA